MTDDSHSGGTENHSDDYQHAIEACEHALENGDLSHAHTFLDEAQAAVERAHHDNSRTQDALL